MQTFLTISALGPKRLQTLVTLASEIESCGCRIVECRILALGNHYAVSMMLAGNWGSIAKFENVIVRLEGKTELKIMTQRTNDGGEETSEKPVPAIPYIVEIVAAEKNGTVSEVTNFFAQRHLQIMDLYSTVQAAPPTSTQLLSLQMTVLVPVDDSIAALRSEFMDYCDERNLDALLAPVK